jgi:hypothetical protein
MKRTFTWAANRCPGDKETGMSKTDHPPSTTQRFAQSEAQRYRTRPHGKLKHGTLLALAATFVVMIGSSDTQVQAPAAAPYVRHSMAWAAETQPDATHKQTDRARDATTASTVRSGHEISLVAHDRGRLLAAAGEPRTDTGDPWSAPRTALDEPVSTTPDPVELLTDQYVWDERSDRVQTLQTLLAIEADGWYSHQTHHAHKNVLAALQIPGDTLPIPPMAAPPTGPSASAWDALRRCESGGNYSIRNRSGKYRGAYQFDRPTWDDVARQHHKHLVGTDPAAASPADQDAMALSLYQMRGAAPWPQCGRHLK